MDRFEAMKIFIAALDEGSLAGASRKTGRSAGGGEPRGRFLEALSACRFCTARRGRSS